MPPRTTRRSAAAAASAAPTTDGAPAPTAPDAAPAPADAIMQEAEQEKNGDIAIDDATDAADDEDDDSTSSSSSDSDSDFEEVDASEEDAAALSKLEETMSSSAPSYDDHLLYVSLLRKCRMKERLRSARRAAATAFPLPESVWLEWISDEKDEAKKKLSKKTISEKQKTSLVSELISLHETALADFLSVPLWLSYLETLRDFDGGDGGGVRFFSAEGAARFRAVADRALALAGLHVGQGEALWRAARAFEVDALRAKAAAVVGDEQRARSLWHRQLSTPLLYRKEGEEEAGGDNAAVRAELLAWEAERVPESSPSLPPHVAAAADAAASAASARAASEEAVSSSGKTDEERLAAFMAYIKLEERALARVATTSNASSSSAAAALLRVALAHERAIAAFPVTAFLWTSYGSFIESNSSSLESNPSISPSSIYSRAVRNCPWVGELWARALRSAERESNEATSANDERFEALFRSAMSSPMQSPDEFSECVLARLDRVRRKAASASADSAPSALAELRAAFSEAAQWLPSAFPTWQDPGLRFSAYWPQCELALGGGAEGAARAWEQLASPSASSANSPQATLSAEFFAAWARAAVESGLPTPGGGEANSGSLRYSPRAVKLGRAILKRALGLDGGGAAKSRRNKGRGAPADDDGEGDISLPPTKKLSGGTAAAASVAATWLRFEREWGTAEDYRAASLKAAPLLEAAAAEATAAATAAAAAAATAEEKSKSKEELLALRRERDPNYKKKEKEKEKEKEKSKEKEEGKAKDKGKEKATVAAAGSVGGDGEEAPAKRARTDVGGGGGGEDGERKPKERSSPAPPAPAPPPRFVPRAADAEHRTAFVRGFPSDATEAALSEFFAKASSLADPATTTPSPSSSPGNPPLPVVRRPRGPDGRPRGFAYVEFETKEALERAVASADGKAFGGGGGSGGNAPVLSVAVSRPPGPSGGGGGRGRGGGGGRGGFGRFGGGGGGRGRGRGVHLDLGGEGSSAPAPESTTTAAAAASSFVPRAVAKSAAPPKSNADFRALFLGGKKE